MSTIILPTVTADVWLPEHDQPIPYELTRAAWLVPSDLGHCLDCDRVMGAALDAVHPCAQRQFIPAVAS